MNNRLFDILSLRKKSLLEEIGGVDRCLLYDWGKAVDKGGELTRTLYCGDNLPILRAHVPDECIDLVYLDPPFYSQRSYRASVRPAHTNGNGGNGMPSIPAFGDTWCWNPPAEEAYARLRTDAPATTARALIALHELLGTGPLLAYLVMIAERLLELHRVLKPAGSLYLHCDPAAGHYLKLLLDAVFGQANFRNEIVWFYKTGGASARHFARKHDLLFFYSKGERYIFHAPKEKSYMMHRYGFKKSTFLRDTRGFYTWVYMKDVWELPALGAADGQRLGYPTQKPEALLERILLASTDEGALVLDPFSGSGTTLVVAQRLGRAWLGIENNHLGLAYQRYRLARAYPDLRPTIIGGPTTLAEAHHLARTNPAQFGWWALALMGARPLGVEGRGTGNVHGLLYENSGTTALVVVALDPLTPSTLQQVQAFTDHNPSTRLLLVTLKTPSEQPGVELLSALGTADVQVQTITIADLLINEEIEE